MNTDLIVLKFSSPTGADAMLQTLKDLQADDFVELLEAVVVTKDFKDQVKVRQPLDIGPGRGAAFGAVSGVVIGLLGGPGGAVVGMVSGAVTGSATAAAIEAGLPKADIKSLAVEELDPGQSALLVYVDEVWIDQIEQAAAEAIASIAIHSLVEEHKISREQAAKVRKEKIDAAYMSWQTKLDKLHTSVTSLHQQAASGLQSDGAAIQKQIDAANSALNILYKHVLQTLRAWQQRIDADIHELETEARQANAEAKADIDRRLVSAKESRQTIRAHVKEILSARLNGLKTDIEHLTAQAAKSKGEAKDKLTRQVARLEEDWAVGQKQYDQVENARDAAWEMLVTGPNHSSLDTYDASVRGVENESEK